MATNPSPPGRFSTTTGLPQRAVNRSANSLAAISTPDPGPSGTMNLTVRCGQVWPWDGVVKPANTARNAAAIANTIWRPIAAIPFPVSYTHLRAHETRHDLV